MWYIGIKSNVGIKSKCHGICSLLCEHDVIFNELLVCIFFFFDMETAENLGGFSVLSQTELNTRIPRKSWQEFRVTVGGKYVFLDINKAFSCTCSPSCKTPCHVATQMALLQNTGNKATINQPFITSSQSVLHCFFG